MYLSNYPDINMLTNAMQLSEITLHHVLIIARMSPDIFLYQSRLVVLCLLKVWELRNNNTYMIFNSSRSRNLIVDLRKFLMNGLKLIHKLLSFQFSLLLLFIVFTFVYTNLTQFCCHSNNFVLLVC